ncbi:nucleotidyltransferase domain-containing protein [Lacrimispora sp. NSJ-141]|uniref:Nucleotidyltransferase domain-containing protein n=1 Tax=Lientehia hominis TaxID=2897778 RepID=A0AAP2RJV0_9FIRM|nr:nucleotidyltransferase domain-containing protein [Lientehia hominis]MCD2492966.1 nucleotidyltransferase domain-containing protein [Lientehia hominis]
MDTLENLEIINTVKKIINENQHLADKFNEVYVFGSILKNVYYPNDLDLLFIYRVFEDKLLDYRQALVDLIEAEIGIPVDVTMLSIEEKEETKFLDLIKKYIRIYKE